MDGTKARASGRKTLSSIGTAPLKPKPGLSGPPANVMAELNFAVEEGKRIFPVLKEDCKRPFRIRALHYADFQTDYQVGLSELLRVLEVQPQPMNPEPPGEPDRPVENTDRQIIQSAASDSSGGDQQEVLVRTLENENASQKLVPTEDETTASANRDVAKGTRATRRRPKKQAVSETIAESVEIAEAEKEEARPTLSPREVAKWVLIVAAAGIALLLALTWFYIPGPH